MSVSSVVHLPSAAYTLGLMLLVGGFAFFAYSLLYDPKTLKRVRSLSLTLEKAKPSGPDYSVVFPPPIREVLPELLPSASPTLDQSVLAKQVLPLGMSYRSAPDSACIYTGFTVREIKQLGDFPNYAKLSGVPLPEPLHDFDIDKAKPRPYRPFRWSYHQTMSLKKLDKDFWIELESNYRYRIRQRQGLVAKHGSDVMQALPGSELACKELMEMVVQFICARYPKYFQLEGMILHNKILNTKDDLSTKEPLRVLLDNVPEDFAITLRDPETGRYIFRAGITCSSVGWTLSGKIGLGLPGIHKIVPDYKEKMEFSMDRFFTKMPASGPIQRGSWGIEVHQPLYLPPDHPDLLARDEQKPGLTPEDLYLRIDWQTLRRLPLSGAIVFNFKALFTPVTEFKDEPYIPSLVLKVLNEGKENIMKYKGTWHIEHIAKPLLKEYETYQVEQGLIEQDWEPTTLAEDPYFPGWERKWTLN